MEKLLCRPLQTWVAKSGQVIISCSISVHTASCIKWEVKFQPEIDEKCPFKFTNHHSGKLVVRPMV